MIPKLVHNIWIQGYNNLPENLKTSYNNIKELNPEWEFIFWDENMIIDLLKKYPNIYKVYQNIENLPGLLNILALKSDIARYIIMKKYGGLYFDIDFICRDSFNHLFNKKKYKDYTIFIASSKIDFLDYIYPFSKPKYCSCFMAFEKEHPIWNKVFDIILKATNAYEIDSALDISLQNSNEYKIIVLNQINGHYKCKNQKSICYTPVESSWNFIRPTLQFINCNHIQIFFIFAILIIFAIFYILNYYNAVLLRNMHIIKSIKRKKNDIIYKFINTI